MSEVKRKLRNSEQADLTGVPEGSQNKKRKSPAASKGVSKKKRHEDETTNANMVQATVEDLSAAKASMSDAKLLDPNTGEEVQAVSDEKPDKASSSKAAVKPKGSNKKVDQLVDPNTGLTFGKAISGMLAQSKGRSIGVFDKKGTDDTAKHEREEEEHAQGIARHDVFGMSIKAKDVGDEGDVRAVDTNMKALNHKQVEGYLQRAFGQQLQAARDALAELANSHKAEEIGDHCYRMYEQFRPSVASGQKGWGQKGQLDLTQICQLAENH
ncbi:hypothetical protein WJX79_008926 [Trebouxia sp. C0005]